MPDLYIDPNRQQGSSREPDSSGKQIKSRLAEHERTTGNPLSAYATLPADVDFANREPDEDVLLLLRQHPITNARWVTGIVLVLLMSALLLNPPAFNSLFGIKVSVGVFAFTEVFLYLLLAAYAFEQFLFWFFNVYIITDRRLVDIDFQGLLSQRISETSLHQVQDVTYDRRGLAPSLFGYGRVLVQTAAAKNNIEFNAVPRPDKVADLISDLIHEGEAG
jgi:membrane protein YdbS with pleckstrin-like domain